MEIRSGTSYWASDEMTRPSRIREVLREIGARPRKSLGQNFLADGNIRKLILDTCRITPGSCVLEIGPGLGAITSGLIQVAGSVIAIEKDPRLAVFLQRRFRHAANLTVHPGDALKMTQEELIPDDCDLMVSNLPYRVASPIMVRFLEAPRPLPRMVVTIHKEAGEKFIARPGDRNYGVLSLVTALAWRVRRIREISPNCFFPRPEVWSLLLEFESRPDAPPPELRTRVRQLTSWIFTQRRKKLGTIVRKVRPPRLIWLRCPVTEKLLQETGISAESRPEQVPPEKWLQLTELLTRDT